LAQAMEITPIKTKKRYVLVIDKLLELIRSADFNEGDRLLPERLMAEKLGVSRPSVREAYCVLEMVGILESRVGSGTYLISKKDIGPGFLEQIERISRKEESPYEILEVRKIIEPEIVLAAIRNAAPQDIREMERLLAKMKAEIRRDGKYSTKTDTEFHLKLAKMSDNMVLVNIMHYIVRLMQEQLWNRIVDGPEAGPKLVQQDLEFHEKIVEYVKTGKTDRLRSYMVEHFTEMQKAID
jgi:GntR family transcriptional repressor for pyruvate dehydrogenase complex